MERMSLPQEDIDCTLDTLHGTHGINIGIGLYLTGVFAVGLNSWLLLTMLRSPALRRRSYFLELNLCVVSLARNLLGGFPFTGTSALYQRWVFGGTYSTVFAFLSQFIGIFHMEALTHMCIERYFTAKYVKFGWEMKNSNYAICVALCWLFSVVYTFSNPAGSRPPSCGLAGGDDWAHSLVWSRGDAWQEAYSLAFALLGGVKPVLVIAWMLWQARKLERQFYTLEKHEEQLLLTRSVMHATAATLTCWVPQGAVAAWLLLSQLLGGVAVPPPMLLVFLASLSSEIAPSTPVLVYLWKNPTIRKAMWSTWSGTQEEKNK